MPTFSFENHASGHLFRWLISSGEIDWAPMIEPAFRKHANQAKAVERFAKAIKHAVEEHPGWDAEAKRLSENPPTSVTFPGEAAAPDPAAAASDRPVAPPYRIWFRPSPSKKIRFEEVAEALLLYAGRQADGRD